MVHEAGQDGCVFGDDPRMHQNHEGPAEHGPLLVLLDEPTQRSLIGHAMREEDVEI